MSGSGILIVGRGLHAPWNEGTRVIGRNVIDIARSTGRDVRTISLTLPAYATSESGVEHVGAVGEYGAASDYRGLVPIARRVRAVTRSGRFGVAHLVGLPFALAPLLKRAGLPVVAHVALTSHADHGIVERTRAFIGGRAFLWAIDAFACAADPVRDELARQGYPQSKLRVTLPPVDTDVYRPRDRVESRAALGIDPDAFVVGYVGQVSPKRLPIDELLPALASVPGLVLEAFAPSTTHGRNPGRVDAVAAACERAAVSAKVRLKDLTDEQKSQVSSAADVMLFPFTAAVAIEPPLTLVEAMASGAIVVAAPFANQSGLVRDGENGIAVLSNGELGAVLARIRGFSPAQRAALGDAARETAISRFSVASATAEMERLWRDLGVASFEQRIGHTA